MARVIQYPHYLFVECPGESVQDENGDWTEQKNELVYVSRCREEKDGRGTEYDVGGGVFHKVTSVIQCPKSCPEQTVGTRVVVANDESCSSVRIAGIVLNCDPAQLHTRIWV